MASQHVRITKCFHRSDVERTGLKLGLVLPSEPDSEIVGKVWVKCPEVPVTRDGKRVMRSDGYAPLTPDEYEVISEEIRNQNQSRKAA